ncbi:FAD-dependent monooxygenase [Streptomyces sp. NPDC013172]|uniref:FAD-dependent monooxygenase n=1 Tax=Streptomyces sp. NPDC013172 TaxID=3155009 RepID=UPI0033D2E241
MPRRAVVIGAGTAGVLAAAALATVVDEVIVLDRDDLPGGPDHRRGVPQGRHAHLLMAGGLEAIDALVPSSIDIRDHLRDAGAKEISLARGMLALTPEGWFRRWSRDGHHMVTCTRALLDWAVRTAVMTYRGISVHRGHARALLGSAARVTGVRVAAVGGAGFAPGFTALEGLRVSADGSEADLAADFVVDASGRGSRIVTWLEEVGITGIQERTLDTGLVNSTRIFRTPRGAEGWPLTLVQPDPFTGEPGRSGMVVPIEDDAQGARWMVSFGGSRGGEPPKDEEKFLQYAFDLPHPIVGQLVAGAEPLTPVFTSHSSSNARRYLEKAPGWPDGLVVLGDALATFNPLYGQGMSVAALSALALARTVRDRWGTPGLARRAQREVAKPIEAAWTLAVSSDVLYPGIVGSGPTLADRISAKYTRRLLRAATGSYPAASALWDVTSVKAGPLRLLRPAVVTAALAGPPLPRLSGPPLTPAEHEILHRLTGGPQPTP